MSDGQRGGGGSTDRFVDLRFALVGGGVTAATMFAGVVLVGTVNPGEGLGLIDAVRPTIRIFAAGTMGAAATVLALMLTVLGFTLQVDGDFGAHHYRRVSYISLLSTVIIVVSILSLLALAFPVQEADTLRLYHHLLYYGLVGLGSLLGGLMVSVALMLDRTVRGLVAFIRPGGESSLVDQEPVDG